MACLWDATRGGHGASWRLSTSHALPRSLATTVLLAPWLRVNERAAPALHLDGPAGAKALRGLFATAPFEIVIATGKFATL
ncbi:hypothetical protein GQ53DRAFT_756094 [Thozetella sp. PMI_491]|nr:hypothetical protein GQ53DRAFT_756094 [Thozetella sp. PMI_491]